MESGEPVPLPRQRIQFSLATLCLIIIFVPALYMVYDRWRPWVVLHTFDGYAGGFDCVSDDSKYLLTSCWADRTIIELHEIKSGQPVFTIPNVVNGGQIGTLAPNGAMIGVGDTDGIVTIWDIATQQPRLKLHGPTGITKVGFSRDSERLMAISEGSIWIWDTRTGNTTRLIPNTGTTRVYFSKDSKRILTDDIETSIKIWDVDSTKVLREWNPDNTPNGYELHRADFDDFYFRQSPCSDRDIGRLSRWEDHYVYDSKSGHLLCSLPKTSESRVFFTPSGEFIICGSKNTNVLRRIHPEWWWGHLPRPEVWIAAISGILLFRRYRRAQRLNRQPSAVLNN